MVQIDEYEKIEMFERWLLGLWEKRNSEKTRGGKGRVGR